MGTKNQNQDLETTWTIDTSNDTYTLGKNASIVTDGETAVEVLDGANNNKVVLKGDVEANNTQNAVNILGNGTHLEIAFGGSVSGDANTGVMANVTDFSMKLDGYVSGNSFTISVGDYADINSTKNGIIVGNQVGIGADEGLNFRNAGSLDAAVFGILADADGTVINNLKGAQIRSDSVAISLSNEGTSEITNAGLIKAATAINDGDGETTIVNKGMIKGNVFLGDGDDIFNTLKGEFKGTVNGGNGDDTYIVNDKDTAIVEQPGFGYDKVRSSDHFQIGENIEDLTLIGNKDIRAWGNGGNNVLTGNGGDNALRGFAGEDYLIGGKGNDLMTGGADTDMFDFRKGTGDDVVQDFVNGEDLVFCLFANNGPEIADLIANHATEKNGGVMITYSDDSLFLKGMSLNQLDETDFFSGL